MTAEEILESIDRRLAELEREAQRLGDARAALVPGAPAPARTPAPPQPRRARPAPSRRYEVVPAGKLIALLGDGEALRTRELAKATGGDPAQILELLKEQESAGEVRRTDSGAATRWRRVTDEDRIAARVAELEALSASGPGAKSTARRGDGRRLGVPRR